MIASLVLCEDCCAKIAISDLSLVITDCVFVVSQDGFVLVGSVAGQRYWSTILNQESIITCGTWTPDDQQVIWHGCIDLHDGFANDWWFSSKTGLLGHIQRQHCGA